jgi:glutaminyl-tRNA synthetase
VIKPLKVIITNYPEGATEEVELINNPEDKSMGTRKVPFCRELYIDHDDFMISPPPKFFRLFPGNEVRLKGAYIIKCEGFKKNDLTGEVEEIYCSYNPETRSGGSAANRKVKTTIHWVSAKHAINAEVRLYDRLFNHEDPLGQKDRDFKEFLNPDSLRIVKDCKVEPSLRNARPLDKFQFQRVGYFCVDPDSTENNLIFNRTVQLKDAWSKISNNPA